MTTLTDKMGVLEDQLAAQNATIAAYIDTVEAKLQLINDNLSILQENGAANTKALLAAMGQTSTCFPCPTPSIVVPPVGTVPIPVNDDHCQRAQAFIATIHDILAAMDTLQSFNVVGSFNVINDTISQVIATVAAGDTVPLPSFPEAVNIAGDYVAYAGERVFSGVGLIEQFDPIAAALTSAVYLAGDAESARSAYIASIEGSGVSNQARLLFEAIGYTALFSYFFDPDTEPDLSGYDGSICGGPAPGGCITLLHEEAFSLTKNHSDGSDFMWFEVPAWADSIQWDVTFSDGLNVLFSDTAYPDGTPASPLINAQGFFGDASNTWTDAHGSTRYFGVGGFFAGLPNGTVTDVNIHNLIACVAE